jgi:hypothetical protein
MAYAERDRLLLGDTSLAGERFIFAYINCFVYRAYTNIYKEAILSWFCDIASSCCRLNIPPYLSNI